MTAKRSLVLFLCLGAMLLFVASCSKKEQSALLRLNLPEGHVSYVLMTTNTHSVFEGNDPQFDTRKTAVSKYRLECLDVDAEGVMTVRQTLLAVRVTEEKTDESFEFDSANPPAEMSPKQAIFAANINLPITMRITPEGRIVDVEGVEAIVERMLDTGPTLKFIDPKIHRKSMLEETTPEKLIGMPMKYTTDAVGVGKSFDIKYDTARAGIVTSVNRAVSISGKVHSLQDSVAQIIQEYQIEATIRISFPDEKPRIPFPDEKPGSDTVTGRGKSTIHLDTRTGLILQSTTPSESHAGLATESAGPGRMTAHQTTQVEMTTE